DLIVSLIGLPVELGKVQVWKQPGSPAFALLWPDLRMVGDWAAIKGAMRSGKLAAFVLRKPDGVSDSERPTKDFKIEFETRFLLVAPDNVDNVQAAYPGLF